MGGVFQVPPLVYRTPRSQAILAPYGVQIEDPPQRNRIDKGKAVAEEHSKSQSWLGHSDEDSSRSTRTKRKNQRTTNKQEEEESVSHKRYNGRRGRSSRKTRTPPRTSGSPPKASRIPKNRKNPSASRRLHFDRSPGKDLEYMQEIREIRDDIQRMERNHREIRGSIRSPGTHHVPFTEEKERRPDRNKGSRRFDTRDGRDYLKSKYSAYTSLTRDVESIFTIAQEKGILRWPQKMSAPPTQTTY
ncbi:hypothetical protein LWI29_010907 [Acer saccharum]|uniref:Uncharacterized protein n=1 Tax=Acer saccharum TaxID=4024 RepID=A0AA39SJB3_ACESA|nr:hypothetical protein LWI29_010907 [Acer saccharum]